MRALWILLLALPLAACAHQASPLGASSTMAAATQGEQAAVDACVAQLEGCLDAALGSQPTPAPTPKPTPVPTATPSGPTPVPTPTGPAPILNFDCAGKFQLTVPDLPKETTVHQTIAPGGVLLWCANVGAGSGRGVNFQFYGTDDRQCGRLFVEIQQSTNGMFAYKSSEAFLNDGNLRFYASPFFPNQPAWLGGAGVYRVKITGGTATCNPAGTTAFRFSGKYR